VKLICISYVIKNVTITDIAGITKG